MVRVYIAKFTEEKADHSRQSRRAHRLLETVLERDYPQVRAPFLLEKDENGKPFLSECRDIYVNLSHSGPYAACAVGDGPVGVDVEAWRKRSRWEGIIKKLHPGEREDLWKTGEAEREKQFVNLWVLKESFLKAEGKGLRLPLDSFYMEGKIGTAGMVRQERPGPPYHYFLYDMGEEACSLAVCSREPELSRDPVWVLLPEE